MTSRFIVYHVKEFFVWSYDKYINTLMQSLLNYVCLKSDFVRSSFAFCLIFLYWMDLICKLLVRSLKLLWPRQDTLINCILVGWQWLKKVYLCWVLETWSHNYVFVNKLRSWVSYSSLKVIFVWTYTFIN